jgi:hypothetical protein
MLTYVSRFISGGLEPFWPHVFLLSSSVLASIAVGAGIIFERPKYSPSVHRIAFWLIVGGIVVEATCTIFLFVFDEGTSDAQQSKIIVLETRLAEFLEPRKLSQGQKDRIIQAIKQFPPVSFVVMTVPEEEPWELVLEISTTLKDNGWKWEPFPEGAGYLVWQPIKLDLPPEGMTISNRFVLTVPPSLQGVARALSAALTDPSIVGMEEVPVLVSPKATRMTIIAGTKR